MTRTDYRLGDSLLGEDDLAARDLARTIATAEIEPRAAAVDGGEFPRAAMEVLGQAGLLGLLIPAEYGGAGATKLQYALVLEEISKACASTGVTFMTQASAAQPIVVGGTDEQRHRWLPRIASGEVIAAMGLTEPGAGSDLASLTTRATLQPDGSYLLNGQKTFITNGGHADLMCILCRTSDEPGSNGISVVVLEGSPPGLTRGRPMRKMGLRGSSTVELFFDDVHVPPDAVLGTPGHGWRYAMTTVDSARLSTAAQALGIAQGAYDIAAAYASERRQFGRPIASFQALSFKLVDMYAAIAGARALLYQVANDSDGPQFRSGAATAKFVCSDVAMRVTTEAVQVLGGYGYMEEYVVERMMRDAKVTQIYDGTNEINRLVVAREQGLDGRAGPVAE